MPKDLIEIEILVDGKHTASNGVAVEFTPADLKEIADSYNPAYFRAPLIVSHNTQGVEDSKLASSEFSYGIPNYLKVVGGKLKAFFDQVAPEFRQWVEEKKLHSVSPSIYLRDSVSNPYPGKLALRHIAALGASPPAIKSLAPLSLSELCWQEEVEGTLSFSVEVTNETVDFGCGCDSGWDSGAEQPNVSPELPAVLQTLREFFISKFNLETADLALPSNVIDALRAKAMAPKPNYAPAIAVEELYSEIDRLRMRLEEVSETAMNQVQVATEPPSHPPSPYLPYPYNYSEWVDFMSKDFGKTLSRMMDDAEIDAAAGAEATGIDEADISAFMDGSKMPSADEMQTLADALGVDVQELQPASKPAKSASKKKEESAVAADMSELEELREQLRITQLEAQHAKSIAEEASKELKRTGLTNFCEELVRDGRLLPSQSGTRYLDFGEGDEDMTLVDFMCSLDDKQLDFMKDYLSTQPVQVDFSEVAPASKAVERKPAADFSATEGYQVTSDRADELQAVLDYCERQSLDPKNYEHFRTAARAVLQGA